MSSAQLRYASPADHEHIVRLDGIAFGSQYVANTLSEAFASSTGTPPRFLLATDAAAEASATAGVVGVAGDTPFTMTTPGGALDVTGVTWVSVSPTHRRRGILRELMGRQLGDVAAEGSPAAILIASEAGIYRRFGYGPASQRRKVVLDRRRAALRQRVDTASVRLGSLAQARAVLPELHRRWRAGRPGAVSRDEAWWARSFGAEDAAKEQTVYLLHPDGYVAYRAKEDWGDGDARHTCVITDYVAVTPDAHAALWQVLVGMDLFATIRSDQLPVDDPLPFLLADGRALRTVAVNDGLWLRPIDVERLLAGRRYGAEVDLVIEVADDLFGVSGYRLTGGPDGAVCRRSDAPPALRCTPDALGSAYLGGHRLSTLAAAGLVAVGDPRVLARADLAFLADRAPAHGTSF